MKKICLLILVTCISLFSFSQNRSGQLGIKAGVNLADYNDNAGTTGIRTGFHAGLLAHLHTRHRNLAVQPELVFSTQGAKFVSGTEKVDYLNLPILLQYLFSRGLRLETGPQFGFLTSARFESNLGVEVSIKDSREPLDISWAFGLGYMNPSGLGLDARFNLGLTDINKAGNRVYNNRVWQIGMFYQFR